MEELIGYFLLVCLGVVLGIGFFRILGHGKPCPKCGSKRTIWDIHEDWILPEDRRHDIDSPEDKADDGTIYQERCRCLRCDQITVYQNGKEIRSSDTRVIK